MNPIPELVAVFDVDGNDPSTIEREVNTELVRRGVRDPDDVLSVSSISGSTMVRVVIKIRTKKVLTSFSVVSGDEDVCVQINNELRDRDIDPKSIKGIVGDNAKGGVVIYYDYDTKEELTINILRMIK